MHRFGKLQDILGHKILNEFLMHVDKYEDTLSMLEFLSIRIVFAWG